MWGRWESERAGAAPASGDGPRARRRRRDSRSRRGTGYGAWLLNLRDANRPRPCTASQTDYTAIRLYGHTPIRPYGHTAIRLYGHTTHQLVEPPEHLDAVPQLLQVQLLVRRVQPV